MATIQRKKDIQAGNTKRKPINYIPRKNGPPKDQWITYHERKDHPEEKESSKKLQAGRLENRACTAR